MFRKVINIFGHIVLLSLVSLYLYFSYTLEREEREHRICNSIEVIIRDSNENRFVSPLEVRELLADEGVAERTVRVEELQLDQLERVLNRKRVIKESQVSYTHLGNVRVEVTQRRPIMRVELASGGFYIDDTGYIFPLIENFTSYVPLVTGNVPNRLEENYRGAIKEEDSWLNSLFQLALFLDEDQFWSSMVDQLHFEDERSLYIAPTIGESEIFFGTLTNMEYKFKKLELFYREIAPFEGWDQYKSVNVDYKGLIVCKKRVIDKI